MAARALEAGAVNETAQRTLSALVLAPIVIGLVWLGGPYYVGLLLVGAGILVAEWETLSWGCVDVFAWGLGLAAVAGAVLAARHLGSGEAVLVLIVGAGVVALLIASRHKLVLIFPLGIVYVGVFALAMHQLRGLPSQGAGPVFWVLAVVWSADIAGYFVGRFVGGAKLIPRVSPGKTWSGLTGALFAAAAVGWIGGEQWLGGGSVWIATGVGVGLAGQIGDLLISWLKRQRKLKDISGLIPGHGGLWDRVDGLALAAPIFALIASNLLLGGEVWR